MKPKQNSLIFYRCLRWTIREFCFKPTAISYCECPNTLLQLSSKAPGHYFWYIFLKFPPALPGVWGEERFQYMKSSYNTYYKEKMWPNRVCILKKLLRTFEGFVKCRRFYAVQQKRKRAEKTWSHEGAWLFRSFYIKRNYPEDHSG